jgi:predicted PurR-regulated permease PerM
MIVEWDKTTKYIVGVGLVLFGLYLLYLSRSVLTLFLIAALIAFLLKPVVRFFHHRCKIPRVLSVLLSYLFLILIILLSPLIFIPAIIDAFSFLDKIDYKILIDNSLNWAEQTLIGLENVNTKILGFYLDLDTVVDSLLGFLQNTSAEITPTATITNSLRSVATVTFDVATNLVGTMSSGVLGFIVILASAIYLSLDGHKFGRQFLNAIPEAYRPEVEILLSQLRKTWRAYFRGQLNLMLFIGLITWMGNTAIGLPGALALGVIAGILELIPGLGPFLAAVPAVIIALLQGSTYLEVNHFVFALIVIGLYTAIQQIENTFIVPHILGEAVDLHPLVVMLGVVVGANVAGLLGALLAAPVIASIREIVRYLYAKILGEDPYPPQEEEPETAPRLSWQERVALWWAKIQDVVSQWRLSPTKQEE